MSIRGSAAIRKRPGPSVLTVAVPWIRISFSTLPSSGISIRPRERSQSRRPVRSGIVPATTRTGRVLVIVRASGSIAISPPDGIRSSPLTRTRPVATFARPFGVEAGGDRLDIAEADARLRARRRGRTAALPQRARDPASASRSVTAVAVGPGVAVSVRIGVGALRQRLPVRRGVAGRGRRRDGLLAHRPLVGTVKMSKSPVWLLAYAIRVPGGGERGPALDAAARRDRPGLGAAGGRDVDLVRAREGHMHPVRAPRRGPGCRPSSWRSAGAGRSPVGDIA